MGINIIYTCDGCGQMIVTKENEVELPEDWIQTFEIDLLLFHNTECAEKWLRKMGRNQEAEDLHNGYWVG